MRVYSDLFKGTQLRQLIQQYSSFDHEQILLNNSYYDDLNPNISGIVGMIAYFLINIYYNSSFNIGLRRW